MGHSSDCLAHCVPIDGIIHVQLAPMFELAHVLTKRQAEFCAWFDSGIWYRMHVFYISAALRAQLSSAERQHLHESAGCIRQRRSVLRTTGDRFTSISNTVTSILRQYYRAATADPLNMGLCARAPPPQRWGEGLRGIES